MHFTGDLEIGQRRLTRCHDAIGQGRAIGDVTVWWEHKHNRHFIKHGITFRDNRAFGHTGY